MLNPRDYKNIPTWLVVSIINEHSDSLRLWAEESVRLKQDVYRLANSLEDHCKIDLIEQCLPPLYRDLTTYALDEVNWVQIAEFIIGGIPCAVKSKKPKSRQKCQQHPAPHKSRQPH